MSDLARAKYGNPTPLAMGAFATTLLTLSLSMMNFRGLQNQTVFIGNLCFVAGIGMLISAQWEMLLGNTFSYTVLTAFSLYYAGYGAILMPVLGIENAYGGRTPEYYNGLGFFVLIWAVLNVFFLIASFPSNVVSILTFLMIELCFIFDAASYFALADGKVATGAALLKTAGAFGFIAGLLGYYAVLCYLCQDAIPFTLPVGDTAKYFVRPSRMNELVMPSALDEHTCVRITTKEKE